MLIGLDLLTIARNLSACVRGCGAVAVGVTGSVLSTIAFNLLVESSNSWDFVSAGLSVSKNFLTMMKAAAATKIIVKSQKPTPCPS